MSILVVCPGCKKRFTVSEKFAGRTGPCPSCKTTIKIPEKTGEVEVDDPRGPGTAGKRAADIHVQPILRPEATWNPVLAAIIGGASLVVLIGTWILGRADAFVGGATLPLLGVGLMPVIGLLLISPPLVIAGYSFLQNDEDLAPYRGKELYLRAGICSLAYIVLWGAYAYAVSHEWVGELWTWLYVAPPIFLAGGFIAFASLDLEYGLGFFHYSFYAFVTGLLRWVAGMGWVWDIPVTGGGPTPVG
ncbi:MAG: zinc ribbon domain-containing protein [Planctomycetota bacterium]|jgi:hypothetical protein